MWSCTVAVGGPGTQAHRAYYRQATGTDDTGERNSQPSAGCHKASYEGAAVHGLQVRLLFMIDVQSPSEESCQ